MYLDIPSWQLITYKLWEFRKYLFNWRKWTISTYSTKKCHSTYKMKFASGKVSINNFQKNISTNICSLTIHLKWDLTKRIITKLTIHHTCQVFIYFERKNYSKNLASFDYCHAYISIYRNGRITNIAHLWY